MSENLIKAEQQFTGFMHSYYGGDIVTLTINMGLTPDEWEEIKDSGEIDHMPENLMQEVDQYFG